MRKSTMQGVCLLFLLLLTSPFGTARAEGTPAPDLTRQCTVTLNGSREDASNLTDGDVTTFIHIKPGRCAAAEWTDDVPAASVYLQWATAPRIYAAPESFTVRQLDGSGNVLDEKTRFDVYLNDVIPLMPDARRIEFSADARADMANLFVLGEGALPTDYHPWEPALQKADYLLLSMHFDDDVVFLGGVIPTYTGEQGLTGAVIYLGTRDRIRCNEGLNGLWAMGMRNYPVLAAFPDIPVTMGREFKDTFVYEEVRDYLVRQIRRLRPEVVVSQDERGEYGHFQHILMVKALREAVEKAGDEAFDADSAAQYGVWQVKKLYLHLYPERKFHLDVDTPLAAFSGRTAYEVACDAFLCHESQQASRHHVYYNEDYAITDFGLAFSAVGDDVKGVSMFEHIPPSCLSNFVPETPAPTQTPAPEPTLPAANTPVAAAKAETPAPEEAEPTSEKDAYALLAALLLLLALCATALVVLLKKSRQKLKKRR